MEDREETGYRAIAMQRLSHSVDLMRDTLKGLLLINGGALIAVMAFLGTTGSSTIALHVDVAGIRAAVLAFGLGTVTAVLSSLAAHLSQNWYWAEESALWLMSVNSKLLEPDPDQMVLNRKIAGWSLLAALLIALGSVGSFLTGSWLGVNAVLYAG